ncbi:MAG: hypothetical protein ACRDT0_11265 [Pseudonocardiaceae bacterium]
MTASKKPTSIVSTKLEFTGLGAAGHWRLKEHVEYDQNRYDAEDQRVQIELEPPEIKNNQKKVSPVPCYAPLRRRPHVTNVTGHHAV